MSSFQLKFNIAEEKDWSRVLEIYNEAVSEMGKTADTEVQNIETKGHWLQNHKTDKHAIILGILEDQIIGWCSISPYRKGRKALECTAEISYYVSRSYRKKGLGSELINYSINYAKEHGIKNLIAILLDINIESIGLLRKFKFQEWGHLPGIANINNKACGQYIFGKKIGEN